MDNMIEDTTSENQTVSDAIETAEENIYDTPGATSFSEIEQVDTVGELTDDIKSLSDLFRQLLCNIEYYKTPDMDQYSAVKKLVGEYVDRLNGLVSEYSVDKSLFSKAIKAIRVGVFKEQDYKTEGGKKFHSSDFAYVPDKMKPSTWKLRLAEDPGKITVAQLGRAAAALSSAGFMGNQVQMPIKSMASAKARVRSEYHKLGVKDDEIPDAVKKKENAMMVWKEANGGYRWFSSYSNAYRDNDNPPEIISSESHIRFVEMVDKKEVDYPELWHWHIPGTAYGKADWVAFDADNKVAMAAGYIYPGHEKEAELLSEMGDIATSHGMPSDTITRDLKDHTIINSHITVEISDLPSRAAANRMTTFGILNKEKDMSIPDIKKNYLRELGFSDEKISEIEEMSNGIKKSADESGIESKEVAEVKEEVKEEVVHTSDFATRTEIATAISEIMTPLVEAIKNLNSELSALKNEVKEVKDKEVLIPPASLAAMIAQNMTSIGSKETQIPKNSTLFKSGPMEMLANDGSKAFEFPENPIIGGIVTGIINKKR
jgi:hypothetical protein